MNNDNKYNKDKDKKDQTKTRGFIVVRPQGHLPCPTPLPEYHTREFSSLCQQTPFRRRKTVHTFALQVSDTKQYVEF